MNERINLGEIPSPILASMQVTENYLESTGLDIGLLELMRVHISQLNGCAYCVDMHMKEGMDKGVSLKRLYSVGVWREVNYYSDSQKAVLEWAELSIARHALPGARDEVFDRLKDHFSVADIANLTLAIGQINSWNCLSKAFGIEAGNYAVAS